MQDGASETLPLKDREDALHRNNIGFMRLLFACAVIVAHASELIGKNDLVSGFFGIWVSFGTIAVDFFFVVSGYLISDSFLKNPRLAPYLAKRIARIYPGFCVAFVISLVVFGPLMGGQLSSLTPSDVRHQLIGMFTLQIPTLKGALAGMLNPSLNGSMYTIAYEFRCYVYVALAGIVGLLAHRRMMLAVTAGLLLLSIAQVANLLPINDLPSRIHLYRVVGDQVNAIRFTTIFACGVCFRLWRDKIPMKGSIAAICLAATIVLLFVHPLAEAAVSTFGAYVIFWIGLAYRSPVLSAINSKNDISYGVYLYGWPITSLLLYRHITNVPLVTVITLLGAGALGVLSWFLVERPSMQFMRSATNADSRRRSIVGMAGA